MNDTLTSNISPSMAISEIKQKLISWYEDHNYADISLEDALYIINQLCNYIGFQSVYTPQIGQSYIEYAEKRYSRSHLTEIKRCIYVLNCLSSGKTICKQQPKSTSTDNDKVAASIPMKKLRQMIVEWINDTQRDNPAKATIYILDHLAEYIGQNAQYTPEIGKSFLECMVEKNVCAEYIRSYKRKIYLLDCFTIGQPIKTMRSTSCLNVVPIFEPVLNEYISYCQKNCKKNSTAEHKQRYARKFLNNLETCGCTDLSELTPQIILKACLTEPVIGCFTYYKSFLKYLADKEITVIDYSPLTPKNRRTTKVPDVYSREEILKLENSYDRETDMGKRDYAIVMLASRLKLRPSDIVTLKFDEIDFDNNHIRFTQQKTGNELSLPLIAELKQALLDYIEIRPTSDSPYVFLRVHAPYLPLSASSVNDITGNGFETSGIDSNGRSTGPRSLRSSGATHMIHDGVPYSVVQKSMGHKNKNVIQHYARLDIPHLMMCALKPSMVTEESFFDRFLKGVITL